MAWCLEGQLFETCNCEILCPCSVYPLAGADYDRCLNVYAFRIDSGQIEGVDVARTIMVLAFDAPKYFLEGNWRLGLLVDAASSEEQAAKLTALFSGQLGGPMAALSGMVSENLGVERVPMQYSVDRCTRVLTVGNLGRLDHGVDPHRSGERTAGAADREVQSSDRGWALGRPDNAV
jgi:hypothetical protein